MSLRLAWTTAALLLVAGCSASMQRNPSPAEPSGNAIALQSRLSTLVGQFGTAIRLSEPEPLVTMRVAPGPANAEAWVLEFLQTSPDGQRGFLLEFQRVFNGTEIAAEFIPMQSNGRLSQQSCSMRFRLLPGVLTGETDPESCRFGEGTGSVGLLKEIALTERQIIIADRLLRSAGMDEQSTDVLRLHRLARFTGSVRFRSDTGQPWRLSEAITLDVADAALEPSDAAGMPLDVLIRLLLIEGQTPEEPLLHLQAVNPTTGNVLGQAWGDAQTDRIGMSLDTTQIDLRRASKQ